MPNPNKSQYRVGDDLVAYRGDRALVLGRWWIGDPASDGTWVYMIRVIDMDTDVDDVPEGNLSDW